MSAQVSSPLHVSSILRTMAMAPPSRDRHLAARQLAGLDPRQFLANLQAAAASRSPHAITALKADMYELDDIFHKLSRAGHDISLAQRDFQMLKAFVSQIASPPVIEKQRHRSQSQYCTSSGSAFVPSSTSPSSHSTIHVRPRSGSVATATSGQHPHSSTRQAPNNNISRSAPGSSPSSTSSSSSSSPSSSRNISETILSPVPHRLTKPRRASAPAAMPAAASVKKVHFATHATVYTFASEKGPTPAPSPVVPPSRPACLPRVAGSFSADGRPRF